MIKRLKSYYTLIYGIYLFFGKLFTMSLSIDDTFFFRNVIKRIDIYFDPTTVPFY